MSAITQASAQVAKTVAVTTGKVANAKSMMIWRPHGNKYVNARGRRDANVIRKGGARGLLGRSGRRGLRGAREGVVTRAMNEKDA